MRLAEDLLAAVNSGAKQRTPKVDAVLAVLVGELAERLLFFDAFGIPVSKTLRPLLEERRLVSETEIARLRSEVLEGMREHRGEAEVSTKSAQSHQEHITACDAVLSDYLVRMSSAVDRQDGLELMRTAVLALNELNAKRGTELMGTEHWSDVCAILIRAAALRGFCAPDDDPTLEWREW